MKSKNIKEVISGKEYDFLRDNENLGNNLLFVTFGGSYAYGTNVETSDIDIRGCAVNSRRNILLGRNFDQVEDRNTDTVIYSFNKLVSLLEKCTPNVIEILGCDPETYIFYNDIGKMLIDNRKMFLSKRAVYSFGGYANQQLRKLIAAQTKDLFTQTEKEKQILSSCKSTMDSFNERYKETDEGAIKLYIDSSDKAGVDTEVFVDVNLKHYPLRDYKNMWSDFNTVVREYGKINHRNNKKDDNHLNKHAMHLVRLYLMVFDILEKQEIVTKRTEDLPLLMKIRNGEFMGEDGKFVPEFFELVNELEQRMKYAKRHTELPDQPDSKQIEDFVVSVNEKAMGIKQTGLLFERRYLGKWVYK